MDRISDAVKKKIADIKPIRVYIIGLQVVISTAVDDQVSALIPRYSILKKQGYRVVIVERHLVFYKINEADKTVIIYAIVDGRKEYRNLI